MSVTIKNHYDSLEKRDKETWLKFNAELALCDKLTYFKRSILPNPRKSLFDLPSGVRTAMIKHLGFTHENFDTNVMPSLPESEYEDLQLAA